MSGAAALSASRPNLALVNAARGLRHRATAEHEEQLEEVYRFFEKIRLKTASAGSNASPSQAGPRLAAIRKCLTLPQDVPRDWFVPRAARRAPGSNGRGCWVWSLDSQSQGEDERELWRHVETLYRLGIPTFLRERPGAQTSLLLSLEAHVLDEYVEAKDEAARARFWAALRDGVSKLVVSAMAKTALDIFGQSARRNVVAVFDATGFSPASLRWKLSMRIHFAHRPVAPEIVRRSRDLVVQCLDKEWGSGAPREWWVAALEPIEHARLGGQDPKVDDISSVGPKFWEHVIDARAHQQGAHHRLVWCDILQGDLPEARPLLPYGLFRATVQLPSTARVSLGVELESIDLRDVPGDSWSSLGSCWAAVPQAAQQQAAPRHIAPQQAAAAAQANGQQAGGGATAWPRTVVGVGAGASTPGAAAAAAAQCGGTLLHGGWVEYRDSEGRPYYHHQATQETRWELPAAGRAPPQSQQFRGPWFTDARIPYYQHLATSSTCWELPHDAIVLPVPQQDTA